MSDIPTETRAAAVAGQFYPGDTKQLVADVDAMLADARSQAPCPKIIVAPHAGYIYSGAIAAQAYARLKNDGNKISRVVLLGPAHRVGFQGIATSSASFYTTPLGQVPLDRTAISAVESIAGVTCRDDAHLQEHSLEVHLPFLQRCLNGFSLVPLVVGQADTDLVATLINTLWGEEDTLLVISSDLSHFLPYEQARSKDADTVAMIENRQPLLTPDQACGCKPLNGLLQVLQQRKLSIETIQVRNSGDTAGNPDRVVGYGSWIVNESGTTDTMQQEDNTDTLPLSLRQQLLGLGRQMIVHSLGDGGEFQIQLNQFHPALREKRGCFVTLNKMGRLRGCIGSLVASRPLVLDLANNAIAAAFKDRRFQPLTLEEYPLVDLHISVLSPATPLQVGSRQELLDTLRPGIDGIILEQESHRSTYLPSVWEKIPDPEQFVSELRAKAGLPKEGWSEKMKVSRYTTEEFC